MTFLELKIQMKSNKFSPISLNPILLILIASLAFIISLFFQLFLGANKWKNDINSQMKIYVYLDDSLDINHINNLVLKLKKLPYLNKIDGKSDILFKSKNITANEFMINNNENFEDLLGNENPFKNLLTIGIDSKLKNENEFKKIAESLSKTKGVYEVTFPSKQIATFSKKIDQISYLFLILMFCFCVFVYIQISNFVKIHIFANRIQIKSMQLLGSTNSYIRKPYLIKSLLHGLIGGTSGCIVTYFLIYNFSNLIPELDTLISEYYLIFSVLLICIGFCCLFSFVATILSLNSKLKTSISNLL